MTVYFSPKEHGLEVVVEADYSRAYEFDIFAVWREVATGRLLYGLDSG